ncbi:MAG: hypothetical protein H7290_15915 [Flavobacterium sp.]|nr:hypothetical protein [Aeromicrobium sp.]
MAETTRSTGRWALGAFLLGAGLSHLTWNRVEFRAMVPGWLPLSDDLVVLASGVVEIALGAALIALPGFRVRIGWIVAAFLVLVLPGNIAQLVDGTDAFGLDSDRARALRLLFQPPLILWALWSTGAWRDRRTARRVHPL